MQTITEHHVLQKGDDIKAQQKRQLDQYAQDQIVSPTQSYLNETLKEHLQGLTPNITAVCSLLPSSPGRSLQDRLQTWAVAVLRALGAAPCEVRLCKAYGK